MKKGMIRAVVDLIALAAVITGIILDRVMYKVEDFDTIQEIVKAKEDIAFLDSYDGAMCFDDEIILKGSVNSQRGRYFRLNEINMLDAISEYQQMIFYTDNQKLYFDGGKLILTYDDQVEVVAEEVSDYKVSEGGSKVMFSKEGQSAVYVYYFKTNKTKLILKESPVAFENLYITPVGGYIIISDTANSSVTVYGADSGRKYNSLPGKLDIISEYDESLTLDTDSADRKLTYDISKKSMKVVDLLFDGEKRLSDLFFTSEGNVGYLASREGKLVQVESMIDGSERRYFDITELEDDVNGSFYEGNWYISLPGSKTILMGTAGKYFTYNYNGEVTYKNDCYYEIVDGIFYFYSMESTLDLKLESPEVEDAIVNKSGKIVLIQSIDNKHVLNVY